MTFSVGRRPRIAGQIDSKLSCAIPLAMTRWVSSSDINRKNSTWVKGRRRAMAASLAIGCMSSSWASRCSAVSSTGMTLSCRAGSCESTSARTLRSSTGARRVRKESRFRAPTTSRAPSA